MELPIRYLNEKGLLDDGETSQMRYVYDIMYGEGEPYHNADWSVVIYPSEVKLVDIPSAAEIFAERYNNNEIPCRYKYTDYIKNKNLQSTIKGLGLDSDAFWLLVMFCYDYAYSINYNGFVLASTRGENIESLINLLPGTEDSKAKLSLRTSKGKTEIKSCKTISLILEWIKRGYEQDKDSIGTNTIDINDASELFQPKQESNPILIWHFASLLRYFFKLHPQFKGRTKKGTTYSLNKLALISKMIYYTELSVNKDFQTDDEFLRGYLQRYKKKDLKIQSNIDPTC